MPREGKVLKVNETDATILNEHGFEEIYPLNAIQKNNQNNNQLLNAYVPKKLENDLKKTPIKSIFKKNPISLGNRCPYRKFAS